jgi:DNA-binding NarL/FixJ family response regulator
MSPRPRTPPVRVLIADDHRLFAEALESILNGERGLDVVGRAANGQEAIELASALTPDVVLLDISMPVLDGFAAASAITKLPQPPAVLMLTGSDSAQDVDRARRAGASGYVTKDAIAARLVSAILTAAGVH